MVDLQTKLAEKMYQKWESKHNGSNRILKQPLILI